MEVETYEAITTDEATGANEDVSEEALALIGTLGLTGQASLVQKHETEDGETVEVRNPYRLFTAEEWAVYTTLFPVRTKLVDYDKGPIPLRMLQVAAHAKDLNVFTDLFVLHPKEHVREDPILFGTIDDATHRKGTQRFILARWGDVLAPFETLREKARALVISKAHALIAQHRKQVEVAAATVEQDAELFLRGEHVAGYWLALSYTA